MKIRSITFFNGRGDARTAVEIAKVGAKLKRIRQNLVDSGYEVQTVRLAFAPDDSAAKEEKAFVGAARDVERMAADAAIDYVSLGPVGNSWALEHVDALIAETSSVFTSVEMKDELNLLSVAKLIKRISLAVPNGFGNLRFAALANCGPGIPFFPAAYAADGVEQFALALECADLAVDAVNESRGGDGQVSAPKAFQILSEKIEKHSEVISRVLVDEAAFSGFDWSLAPHPDERCSVGAAIEALSGRAFGEWGTLSAVAGLTRAIRAVNVRHVGFSGVFMPVLEDAVLARRGGADFDAQKLLLYSAVCGTGLDTVPLAGDVSEEAIAALLEDVATMAAIKGKPLTARLMPVPGLTAGEMTRFDFPYLVNGRVFELESRAQRQISDSTRQRYERLSEDGKL